MVSHFMTIPLLFFEVDFSSSVHEVVFFILYTSSTFN